MFAVALIAALIIVGGVAAYEAFSTPAADTATVSTYYGVAANSVLASAIAQNQAGYSLQSSKPGSAGGGTSGADWAVLKNSDGSSANMSVIVFPSTNASQGYYSAFVAGVKGLPGYTDVSSDLSSFQKYGRCYAFGEDVDGIAVVNGICTKGNVVLQAHLVSGVTFQQLDSDMVSLMGSIYESIQ